MNFTNFPSFFRWLPVRIGSALSVAACAGASPPPAASAPAVAAAPAPVAPPAPDPDQQPPAREPPPNRCLPSPPPVTPEREAWFSETSCADHRAREKTIATELIKRFSKRHPNGRVEVSFGCDPIGEDVRTLLLERGSGHGGTLELWRITREQDNGAFDVLAIANDSYYGRPATIDGAPAVRVARGTLSAKDLEQALVTARPAMTARIRELRPPPSPGLSLSGFSSSGNFHHFIEMEDGYKNGMRREFTGYPGSGTQNEYLGLQFAMEALAPLLDRFDFAPERRSPELTAWFSERAERRWPAVQDSSQWWVRERFVKLGGKLGDARLIPMIVQQLEHGLGEVAKAKPDDAAQRADRYLTDPLAALTGVTGWNPRLDESGAKVPLVAAAKAAVAECNAAAPAARRDESR